MFNVWTFKASTTHGSVVQVLKGVLKSLGFFGKRAHCECLERGSKEVNGNWTELQH